MNGRKSRTIRRAARQFAKGPTIWRRVDQRDKRSRVIPDSQVICAPGTFRDYVKQFKLDCRLMNG